jgi:hypothetical protein
MLTPYVRFSTAKRWPLFTRFSGLTTQPQPAHGLEFVLINDLKILAKSIPPFNILLPVQSLVF